MFSRVQKALDRLNRQIQENLQAVRLIKAYLRGRYEADRFNTVADELRNVNVTAFRIMEFILPVLLLVMNISLLAVLWVGADLVNTGEAPLGDLVAIVNYVMRMTGAFSMFAFIIIFFARAKASSERMEEVLLVNEDLEVGLDAGKLPRRAFGEIEFDNVSFRYPNTKDWVLENISFRLKSGDKLAVMGATGAGKSTLFNLIPRFFEVTRGTIKVDGVAIEQWPLRELRETIGYVPQQSVLFTGSIQENLGWGDTEAEEELLVDAARKAQIHSSIEDFPNQYQTRVGQKGVNLSGGQKQRLSIARAIVRRPEILLLDDSTSALDVNTENALWEALEVESATMLVITQKIRTARGADAILLLDDGKVAGFGSHEELLQTSELYRAIAESQQEGGDEHELLS